MLFHVEMAVHIPHDVDPETVRSLGEREHARAAELQRQGKWLHLWRIVGRFANVSIFEVDSPAEMHAILESLPFYPYMTAKVTALCHHPGAIVE